MNSNKTVRWGVIGLGWFGEIHAETLADMPGIELAAVCTRRPERLAQVADRFHVPKRYTDYRELLADPAIDVIGITTHVDDHRDIAIDALRSGKHVFLEKPMAPTAADCDQILAAANEASGLFMVGHICRFDPRVALAKQAIDEGRIGKIVSMHARRNLSKTIGRTVLESISALMGDGIHDGDLMLWFSQAKPVSVYAQEIHPGGNKYPDGGWAMARLDNGAIAVIESIWHLPESTPYQIDARMEIIGAEGAIYINWQSLARHGVLAAGVRPTVRHPASRASLLRRLRGRGAAATAYYARGIARRRGLVGRRGRIVAHGPGSSFLIR
jgi:UDP-N-acetylglucosamine 3-dehydrogenase